jgi:hypothetical protein
MSVSFRMAHGGKERGRRGEGADNPKFYFTATT